MTARKILIQHCMKCPYHTRQESWLAFGTVDICRGTNRRIATTATIPDWCPLPKEEEQKK
jgi:hypothetical protein